MATLLQADTPVKETRVLVLDDEWAVRQMFQAALEDQGCAVDCAPNGRVALQMLMQQSFDVLVVDLKMEGMDGTVFLEEALKVWPWLGVVIVSGSVAAGARARATALGVSCILEKPVQLKALYAAVRDEAQKSRRAYARLATRGSLDLIRTHLKLLAKLGSRAMRAESLAGALRELGDIVAMMLTADAVGILVVEDPELAPHILIVARRPLAASFTHRIQAELVQRYEALTGKAFQQAGLDGAREGVEADEAGPAEPLSLLSVPVLADDDFGGLITVGASAENAYDAGDISLLYHAANHISAVFLALRRMQHLATRDYLTGVFNRIRMEEELERAWLVSRRYDRCMGVVVTDLDNFKTLNDSYGHAVGDEVLREFSSLIKEVARASDIVARYGGDEFVIILPMADETDAHKFGQRFVERMRTHLFCGNSHRLNLSCSVGIATSDNPTAPATVDELLGQADRALFTAKRAGRDRICIWPAQTLGAVPAQFPVAAGGVAVPSRGEPCGRLAVVDDEATIRDLVVRMLKPYGYAIETFGSAAEAVKAVKARPGMFDIVLTDLALPGESGLDLLREVGEIDGTIIRIVMTGYATVDGAVNSLRQGAYDFIQKPVRQAELAALISRALEYRQLKLGNARYEAHLEEMVRRRSVQLAASLEESRKSYEFTLDAMVAMLDARERQTGKHSIRTRELAVTLARRMGLVGEEVEAVASGAFLHDIGKIGIPDSILLKPGQLEAEEWKVMKTHSEIGFRILRSNPSLKHAADVVYSHHEHYDGSGYPRGLSGEQIAIGARVFAVVDAYDTMRSERVYRRRISPAEAAAELRRCSASQFDPRVVQVFIDHQEEMERILTGHNRDEPAAPPPNA